MKCKNYEGKKEKFDNHINLNNFNIFNSYIYTDYIIKIYN